MSSRTLILCAYLTMVILAAATSTSAIIIVSPALSARAEVVASDLGNFPVAEDLVGNPATASDSLTNGNVTSTAQAIAAYGILKAQASIEKPTSVVESFNFATGTATFSDVITVTGGSGSGTISFESQITGDLQDTNASGAQHSRADLNLFLPEYFQGYNEQFFVESGVSRTLNETVVTSPLNFTFGEPYMMDVKLEAFVQLEETDQGTAFADLLNTTTMTDLTVTDATGPVTVSGQSGTTYPVPEPASFRFLAPLQQCELQDHWSRSCFLLLHFV